MIYEFDGIRIGRKNRNSPQCYFVHDNSHEFDLGSNQGCQDVKPALGLVTTAAVSIVE
jgi:hypothetical protein